MKRLIRRIINWAYGRDISSDLILLWESKRNLSMLLYDQALRDAVKGGTGIKEEEMPIIEFE